MCVHMQQTSKWNFDVADAIHMHPARYPMEDCNELDSYMARHRLAPSTPSAAQQASFTHSLATPRVFGAVEPGHILTAWLGHSQQPPQPSIACTVRQWCPPSLVKWRELLQKISCD